MTDAPTPTYNQENMQAFWHFINERQTIWHKRHVLGLQPPWTDDPVLREYFFCNVYRELDTGTKFWTDTIMPKVAENPNDLVFNLLIYRYFNAIPTFRYLMGPLGYWPWDVKWDHKEQASRLTAWQHDNQVFTGAFTVTGVKFGGYPDKVRNVCFLVEILQDKVEKAVGKLASCTSLRDVYYAFRGLDGFGAFLAYQVAVDYAYWRREIDRDVWAEAGPGCKTGLKWIFPEIRGERQFQHGILFLSENQEEFFKQYGHDFPKWEGKRVVASDIENCLCEFSKYMRTRTGRYADGKIVTGGGKTRRYKYTQKMQIGLGI